VVEIVLLPQRVQLEQFAGIILIRRTVTAEGIVEVEPHGDTLRHIPHHVPKIAQTAPPDDITVVQGPGGADAGIGIGINVEVVVPELDQHLTQLPFAVDGADQGGSAHLFDGTDALLISRMLRQGPELRQSPVFDDRAQRAHFIDCRIAHTGIVLDAETGFGNLLIAQSIIGIIRVQLLINIGGQSHLLDTRDIARARSICHAVERDQFDGRVCRWLCLRGCPKGDAAGVFSGKINHPCACHGCTDALLMLYEEHGCLLFESPIR
jgi:hypothetical protein